MHDVTLPGGSGWFDLVPLSKLTVDQQDEYWDLRSELTEARRRELPPPGPDPRNPAQMLPQQEARLRQQDVTRLQALIAGWSVAATSFEGVLPWHDGSRRVMGLVAWNHLRTALAKDGAHFDVIQGVVPKEESPATTGTSGTSSPGAADAPPPASAPATSGTPTG
jgi:hypothetical protein